MCEKPRRQCPRSDTKGRFCGNPFQKIQGKGSFGEMHTQQLYELAKQHTNYRLAEAEQRRLGRLAACGRPTLRARMARRFFEAAVTLEREETWRIVWERLEARGRL